MHIFDVIIFFELRTIQQKTVKPTYLSPFGARKLAEGKGHETEHKTCKKDDYIEKFARFVLFRPIKKRSFNLLCVLDLFFRTLAVNSVSDFSDFGLHFSRTLQQWAKKSLSSRHFNRLEPSQIN